MRLSCSAHIPNAMPKTCSLRKAVEKTDIHSVRIVFIWKKGEGEKAIPSKAFCSGLKYGIQLTKVDERRRTCYDLTALRVAFEVVE